MNATKTRTPNHTPQQIACLACAAARAVPATEVGQTGECPRCGYLGWTYSHDLDSTTRRMIMNGLHAKRATTTSPTALPARGQVAASRLTTVLDPSDSRSVEGAELTGRSFAEWSSSE